MEPTKNIKIFLDARQDGIVQPDGSFANKNSKDWYIDIFMIRDMSLVHEYIDISLDPTREKLERQLVNPFFIELGFFETVNRIGDISDTGSTVANATSLKGKAGQLDITINS